MRIKEYAYGEAQRPHHQFPLREPAGKSPQERWIVALWGKDTFSLVEAWWNGATIDLLDGTDGEYPYSELWRILAVPIHGSRKWWLIGHGTAYALDRADFIAALERGAVRLPRINKGKNKGNHGGKLTLSRRIVEVDLLCGRNRIKLLDWLNFSVSLPTNANGQATITLADCCNTLQSWLQAMTTLKVEVVKTTAAQLGWSHCRSRCLSRPLSVNLDPECRALERRAYHAGRNECFRLGKIPGTTYSLDIKSCYANICLSENLPIRLIEEYRHGLDAGKLDPNGPDHWIADVVLKTDVANYPLRWEGTPIYPVGQFRTSLPWPELRQSLSQGHVVKVLRAARYEAAPVLREYAEWYLDARQQACSVERPWLAGCIKSMFNASLGYTARQKYEWQPWETQLGFPYWLGIAKSPVDDQTAVQAQKLDTERRWLRVDGEPREAMPFLHATICSYARVKLLEIFAAAHMENILYCDTDGILVTKAGVDQLRGCRFDSSPYPLGLVQRFEPGRCTIHGQKSYRVGDQVIHAGCVDTRRSALAVDDDSIAVGSDEEITPSGKRKRTVRVLTCRTGRPSLDGPVTPFRFDCQDSGDQSERWPNELVG